MKHAKKSSIGNGIQYRGTTDAKTQTPLEIVPVTEGLVECPVCKGGVKLVQDMNRWNKKVAPKVLARHRFGGTKAYRTRTTYQICAGAHTVYTRPAKS